MAEIMQFPNGNENTTKTVDEQIIEQNEFYLNGTKDKAGVELEAIRRTGSSNVSTAEDIKVIVDTICDIVSNRIKTLGPVQAPAMCEGYLQSVLALFHGGVISPIIGDDEEWEDTTVPEDKGQKLSITYRGRTIEIEIESVQVNIRYPKIYRLNNDNRLAHRIDYIQFHDIEGGTSTHLTSDSIRFIQFPYHMDTIHMYARLEEGQIVEIFSDEVGAPDPADGLIYQNMASGDPMAFVIAPKVPFYMLEEEFDINLENEIAEFQQRRQEEMDNESYSSSTDSE